MHRFLLLPFLFSASAAFAQLELPAEKWIVDWGEQRCSLVRRSGGADSVTMVLRASLGTHRPELVLERDWKNTRLPLVATDVEVFFSPVTQAVTGYANTLRAGSGERLLFVEGLAEDFFDQFAASKSFTIQHKGRELLTMRYPAARAAIRSLRACNDDLLASWGVDPKVLAALSRQPRAINPATWIRNEDYPDSAVRAEKSGSTVIRFVISAEGRISDCTPVVSSGTPELDAASCRLMVDRAKYEPALDADGKPISVRNVQTVNWVITGI